jgi:hypothetical protein
MTVCAEAQPTSPVAKFLAPPERAGAATCSTSEAAVVWPVAAPFAAALERVNALDWFDAAEGAFGATAKSEDGALGPSAWASETAPALSTSKAAVKPNWTRLRCMNLLQSLPFGHNRDMRRHCNVGYRSIMANRRRVDRRLALRFITCRLRLRVNALGFEFAAEMRPVL